MPISVCVKPASVAVDSLHPVVAAPLADAPTRRLSLRRLDRDDIDALAAISANADMWRFEYERGLTRVETEAFLSRQLR